MGVLVLDKVLNKAAGIIALKILYKGIAGMKNLNSNTFHKLPILDGLELFNAKKHCIDFPFHTHTTFNITLILEQPFSTKLLNSLLQAPVGTICITNPHEVHATICDNKIGNSFFTFYISPDVLKALNGKRLPFFDDKIIYDEALFQQLYSISQNIGNPKFDVENKLLKTLKQFAARYANISKYSDEETKLFQSFLENDSFEKFSLEKAAKKFGLNKYKFLRLFKQETGLTPNNYIILKRVEKCKELLNTQDDLLDIAIETGFYDATHLCKYFKKITGITPLMYRNA